jgi:mRNA-degrading endonuclease RelE of RelBE toxin-antitoxin system
VSSEPGNSLASDHRAATLTQQLASDRRFVMDLRRADLEPDDSVRAYDLTVDAGSSQLLVKTPAREQLAGLPPMFQQRLTEALRLLSTTPLEVGLPLVEPYRGKRCLDFGRYRIVYKVAQDGHAAIVEAVRHRT